MTNNKKLSEKNKTVAALLLSTFLIVPLAACQTTAAGGGNSDRINAALERAADQAGTSESLPILESMYKRDSGNPTTALKYATALHNDNRLSRALLVLAPFAENGKYKDNADILTEYALLKTEAGSYDEGEAYARKAVVAAPDKGQAYHILGIALDAQGHHPQAEAAFRKALDNWQGDPVPVMNNLGLNLATQGFIDEAIDTLRKAASMAPERMEIERNLRIVSALQIQPSAGGGTHPPHPKRKPVN